MTQDTSQPAPAPRRVAILGSSGGNLRSHGGNDAAGLIRDVRRQIDAAGFILEAAQFVSASASMDNVSQQTSAQLWTLESGEFAVTVDGTLAEVNAAARERDAALAQRIRDGEIDGLVLISADPEDTSSQAITAAAEMDVPAAGTGGTSIAKAQQRGVKLVSASGTTGTTSTTRAVAYVSGLARHWKVKYRPVLGGSSASPSGDATEESVWRRFSIRGIMVGSIPAFIALALTLAVSKIPGMDFLTSVFDLLIAGLPIVVAAVAARKISGLGEVGLVAGVVAGILSVDGG
ncbi:MAG: PTS sugar transporter, partial [Stackebrandtia sp.]